ncbi:MAG: hypothetical protein MJK12_00370 [Colwellia sp.]|nr:hypothetical protein [Colwellia sp.]
MTQVHILNGDSLKYQFPKDIIGEIIIMRECLVDGDIQGKNLDEFFVNRANFLESYDEVPKGAYFETSVPELEKIAELGQVQLQGKEVYCWFEEDLFCQANFWFVLYLLAKQANLNKLYFVRPKKGCEYSFGHMNQNELTTSFNQCTFIPPSEIVILAKLWPCYQQGNFDEMLQLCQKLPKQWQFLQLAVHAQIDRAPDDSGFGRPERILIKIIKELETESFAAVFQEFVKREAIYSFGDLQVKRMFDEVCKNKLGELS